MKKFLIVGLLIVSVVLAGCIVEEFPDKGALEPVVEEQSFDSEEAAFNALTEELESLDDLSIAELEQALQE